MLLNQIDALGDVSSELRKVNSLLTLLDDYFKKLIQQEQSLNAVMKLIKTLFALWAI